jgi:hypothetical protein
LEWPEHLVIATPEERHEEEDEDEEHQPTTTAVVVGIRIRCSLHGLDESSGCNDTTTTTTTTKSKRLMGCEGGATTTMKKMENPQEFYLQTMLGFPIKRLFSLISHKHNHAAAVVAPHDEWRVLYTAVQCKGFDRSLDTKGGFRAVTACAYVAQQSISNILAQITNNNRLHVICRAK